MIVTGYALQKNGFKVRRPRAVVEAFWRTQRPSPFKKTQPPFRLRV
jgi:hypothetical protein